jgi:hypothetical protein
MIQSPRERVFAQPSAAIRRCPGVIVVNIVIKIPARDPRTPDTTRASREKVAEAAGTNPDELLEVRKQVLDFLVPASLDDGEPLAIDNPAVAGPSSTTRQNWQIMATVLSVNPVFVSLTNFTGAANLPTRRSWQSSSNADLRGTCRHGQEGGRAAAPLSVQPVDPGAPRHAIHHVSRHPVSRDSSLLDPMG